MMHRAWASVLCRSRRGWTDLPLTNIAGTTTSTTTSSTTTSTATNSSTASITIAQRHFSVRRRIPIVPLAKGHNINSVLVPERFLEDVDLNAEDDDTPDPDAYVRNAITSAHMVDAASGTISMEDSVTLTPEGGAIHGRYGDLGKVAKRIPLEYLALLHPAAEAAAALRTIEAQSKHEGPGTVLVYGASQPSGMAAMQLANAAGHTVVAVVGCEHSGHFEFMECLKGMLREPGVAVAEQYAACKGKFRDLVHSIVTGDDGTNNPPPVEEYLEEFKKNLLAYAEVYPDTRVAAIGEHHLRLPVREIEREHFSENMEAYFQQFTPGSPKFDKDRLDEFFTPDQYAVFRDKFWQQTTDIITTSGQPGWSAAHIVQELIEYPETLDDTTYPTVGPEVPYSFPVLKQTFGEGVEVTPGGPILGAIVAVTPYLKVPAEAVSEAKGIRAKAEALEFVSKMQRLSFYGASAVTHLARQSGAPIIVTGGSLPELQSAETTDADVKEAFKAMLFQKLKYFVQLYRASDFPFYEHYAVHRAQEKLSGPRQLLVTK